MKDRAFSRSCWRAVVQVAALASVCCTSTIGAAQGGDASSKASEDQRQQCAIPKDASRTADARDEVRVSAPLETRISADQNQSESRTVGSASESRGDDLRLGSGGDKDATKAVAEPECKNPNLSVTYENGRLAIVAHNVPLSDVLETVGSRIGARIDFPPGSLGEPVFIEVKPTKINTALSALLEGTNLNYVVVASSTEQLVQRVVITDRLDSPTPDHPAPQTASAASPRPEVLYQQAFRVDSNDDSQMPSSDSVAAGSRGEGSGGSEPALSDRAKMLDELQKRQIRELDEKAAQAERK